MLALSFLIVLNVADFHQAGAASSAPSWMRDGAYVRYKGVQTCTPATSCHAYPNGTGYELIEFVAVHEDTADIQWTEGSTPQEESVPSYGYLDLKTGILTYLGKYEGTTQSIDPFPGLVSYLSYFFWAPWISNQTLVVTVPGFPPDSSKYAGVECRLWSSNGGSLWYDRVTDLLVERRVKWNTGEGSVVWIVTLYETNIPVGNQALVSVETYPTVVVAVVAVVCLAAVGFAMFRRRTAIVCGQCGRKMHGGSIFCDKCGARMRKVASEAEFMHDDKRMDGSGVG